ncbi:MAG TPA: hypothetical protein VN922_19695 [Bacteroidia bacterium]|nr:hypothetical protein [Bacteroidia bacterium]
MARIVNLPSEQKVVFVKEVSSMVKSFSVENTNDNGTQVIALISFSDPANPSTKKSKNVIVWDGDDYKKIGDWTDAQVDEALLKLI